MKRFLPLILATTAVAVATTPAAADRLHLESGGVIETADWWFQDETLLYRSGDGIVGIPRSIVLRIERRPLLADERAEKPAPSRRSAAKEAERRKRIRELIAEGRAAFDAGDYEAASRSYFHALSLEPEAYMARVPYVVAEIQLNQDASALAAVLDGLVLHPEGAELHELLGDLRDREENVEDALRSWRRAFDLAPNDRLRDKIEKGERDLDLRRDYDLARTSHFNLRYDGDVDEAIAAEVSEHLEERFWDLTNRFDHTPQQPITALLYTNQAFREVTRSGERVGGVYDGKIRVPLGGLQRLHRDARRVLTHELTHAVVHSKSRGHCPRWLHEGLAQVTDGTRLTDARRREVRERLAGLDDPAEWETDEFSYAAAHSLVLWLEARRDFSHLVWLLEALGEGRPINDALRRIYSDDYAGLCRQWAAEQLARSSR
ncbi:MAG: hypothetical protein GTN89_08565 [Acidobacteria bacterium]|nr:hypothetical protein [Acidobacteriota bacterium]NIM63966.1 hypothetical protein [Acidobacteriota bacterium]NIO59371.1 hypothetical protein [Acidobacteriota bacterium]NIQ30407.1 hypothetical protein [Acidobacteriota bacterium]NIQ85333.1 hypothetical protein [Acidobacteriota bacterium]